MSFFMKSISICWIAIIPSALSAVVEINAQQLGSAPPPAPQVFRPGARISSRYVPKHLRTASTQEVIQEQPVIGDNSIIYQESVVHPVVGSPGCDCGGHGNEIVGGNILDGPYSDSLCNGCRDVDCRDCGIAEDCWLGGLGGLLYNSEYFTGVQAFESKFLVGNNPGDEPASFGYNLGFNSGLPLYRLSCGLVSGQIGVRWVQANFGDNLFSNNSERDQTFLTFGLYRRVDHGLQFGVVADYLRERWIVEQEMVQVRGELSWVYPAGHAFGFRFAKGVQDSTNATAGAPAQTGDILDTYRFFYTHACAWGGYSDFFAGWSSTRDFESQGVLGVNYDLPLSEQTALQSGFTYLTPSNSQSLENDPWNLYLVVSWRPRGRGWYKFYHRPLLPVADNGSMVIVHQ